MTIVGLIVALILLIAGYKPTKYGGCLHFEVGKGWGGVSLGVIFLTSENPSTHTKNHEVGHSIQNCYWGLLMPFVICIPSVIRYWYREYLHNIKQIKYSDMTPYDGIWFEGQASKWGTKFIGDNI